MTITASGRQRLEEIRRRKASARDAMARARKAVEAATAGQDVGVRAAAEVALENARGELLLATELESTVVAQVSGITTDHFSQGPFDDPDTIHTLERMAGSSMPIGRVDLGQLMSREDLCAMIETGSWGPRPMAAAPDVDIPDTARVGRYFGIVPQLRRKLRLLDLIPTQTMDSKSFDYTRESGNLDDAAEVAEGTIKPAGDLELIDATVEAKVVAVWTRLKRPQLADVPSLDTTARTRLMYKVMRRVENQIVGGDGTGENLTGLLHTTGIAEVAFAAGTPLTDLSLTGITDVIMSDAEPNAVVANPVDVEAMLTAKAAGSGVRLDSDGAFGGSPPSTMWGLPLIQTRVCPQGKAIVGDWTQGCTLYIREGVNLRISDSDQDAFVRNELVYLAEGRFGLAVWNAACFAFVDFA